MTQLWSATILRVESVRRHVVEGTNEPPRCAPPLLRWLWIANSYTPEPVIGQLILKRDHHLQWVKTCRSTDEVLGLSLATYAEVAWSAQWPGRLLVRFEVSGVSVQSFVSDSMLPWPLVTLPATIHTGQFVHFFRIDSSPPPQFGELFVLRREVGFGRKSNWKYGDTSRSASLPGVLGQHWRARMRDTSRPSIDAKIPTHQRSRVTAPTLLQCVIITVEK